VSFDSLIPPLDDPGFMLKTQATGLTLLSCYDFDAIRLANGCGETTISRRVIEN
jgi:hypothetical protein